jgi:lipid A 3-O-deacylase
MRVLSLSSIAALAFIAASPSFAAEPMLRPPSSMFVQGGSGKHVDSAAFGLTWDWRWERETGVGIVTGYTELDVARWRTRDRAVDEGFTRFGVTPVLRLYPSSIGQGWFAEAGVGANWISPRYHNDTKVFSTTFNFGDRIAVGRRFGPNNSQEVSVGYEHYSNAGITKPNPGENFVQLRYAYRF